MASLPAGLVESDRIDPPIFTPATKAEAGHDENVAIGVMAAAIASATARSRTDSHAPGASSPGVASAAPRGTCDGSMPRRFTATRHPG